jgi:ADP-ribosylglycohydrolase
MKRKLLDSDNSSGEVVKFLASMKTYPDKMLGAIAGDTIGSVYEWHNIKYKPAADTMAQGKARFTDDSVMTCAVADGIMRALSRLPDDWYLSGREEGGRLFMREIVASLKLYGRRFPRAGYGASFCRWLISEDTEPYNSWGNGSAMRVSFAGWAARSLEEAEALATYSAAVTHNHPEGIKGAKAVAGSIFTLRNSGNKDDVRRYASQYYNLGFMLNDIRESYTFDVSCQGSVPQAIVAFLTGNSFVDVVAEAISIGGDSDTLAAMAGSMAEVIYPIPDDIAGRVAERLDPYLLRTVQNAAAFLEGKQEA